MTVSSTFLAAAALLAVAAPAASAQTPPTDGTVSPTGTVPSMLELVLTPLATPAFASFPAAKTYTATLGAMATTTDPSASLSIADAASGAALGRLTSGSRPLALPLQVAAGTTAFQPLDTTVDPQLTRWTAAVSRSPVTIKLRQQTARKVTSTGRKVLLVTLAGQTP